MGVGMNGHIGLNEPGCSVLNHSSVVDLSEPQIIVIKEVRNIRTAHKLLENFIQVRFMEKS
jgi:6-phosphogluconolactonase/glucosamine-6-phosphate isomerase/deaminase